MRDILSTQIPYKIVYPDESNQFGTASVVYTGEYDIENKKFGSNVEYGTPYLNQRAFRELFAHWRHLNWEDKALLLEGTEEF